MKKQTLKVAVAFPSQHTIFVEVETDNVPSVLARARQMEKHALFVEVYNKSLNTYLYV